MKLFNKSCFRQIGTALCCCLFSATTVTAQLPVIQLRSVFPPGGEAGKTATIEVIEGDDLDELSRLVFSHPGITVNNPPDSLSNPRKFETQIAADVPPGYYAVRALGKFGLSNEHFFCVEQGPTTVLQEAELHEQKPFPASLNSIYYSRIESSGDSDTFQFELTAGQFVQVRVDALSIDSRLQPVIELYNPQGRRVEYARQQELTDPIIRHQAQSAGLYQIRIHDFLFRGTASYNYRLCLQDRPSPQLAQSVVPAGTSAASLPAFLPVWKENGWQWEPTVVSVKTSNSEATSPGFLSPRQSFLATETWQLTDNLPWPELAALPSSAIPQLAEKEPNDQPEQSLPLTLPVEVTGHFHSPEDKDFYHLLAKKGETYWIEIFAERAGQSLDPFLVIEQVTTDAQGNTTAKSTNVPDDLNTNLFPNVFDTLTDDAEYKLVAPEDGLYRIVVRNRYGSAESAPLPHYRLRISEPQPGFQAIAVPVPNSTGNMTDDTPAGTVIRKGGTAALKILLHRQHGLNSPVLIRAENTIPGVEIREIVIPPGVVSADLILQARPDAPAGFARVALSAQAISETDLQPLPGFSPQPVRAAAVVRKAETTYPGFSRLGRYLSVAVIDETLPAQLQTPHSPPVLHVTQGQIVWSPVTLQRLDYKDKVSFSFAPLAKDANVDVTFPEIAAAGNQSLGRFHFKANAQEGWQQTSLKAATTINYIRNPELLAREESRYRALENEQLKFQQEQTKVSGELKTAQTTLQQQMMATEVAVKTKETVLQQLAQLNQQLMTITQQLKTEAAVAKIADLEQQQTEINQKIDKINLEMKSAVAAVDQLQADLTKTQQLISTLDGQKKQIDDQLTRAQNALAEGKKQLDKIRTEQKPKPLKHEALIDHYVFHVHKAPATLVLKTGGEVKLPRNGTATVSVELKRLADVAEPVQISLLLPPGVQGISTETVTLAGEQTTTDLVLTAAADATTGKHVFTVLRGSILHDKLASALDVPFTLEVTE